MNPIESFIAAFQNMSKFRWHGEVLFMGESIPANDLPWYYVLVWFGISTPVMITVLGVVGAMLISVRFLKNPLSILKDDHAHNFLLYLICLLAPVTAVIRFNLVLYDGWRHLFFVYSPFVLLAVYTLNLLSPKLLKWGITDRDIVHNRHCAFYDETSPIPTHLLYLVIFFFRT